MGIRLAIGARPGQVRGLVLRQGFAAALPGIVVGGALALAASSGLRSALYGVAHTDPVTAPVASRCATTRPPSSAATVDVSELPAPVVVVVTCWVAGASPGSAGRYAMAPPLVPVLLLVACGLASDLPARRATRVDPAVTLRAE